MILPDKKFKNWEIENICFTNSPLFICHSPSLFCISNIYMQVHMQPWAWLEASTILAGSWQDSIRMPDLSLPNNTYPPCTPLLQGLSQRHDAKRRRSHFNSIILSTYINFLWITLWLHGLAYLKTHVFCRLPRSCWKSFLGPRNQRRDWQLYHHIKSLYKTHPGSVRGYKYPLPSVEGTKGLYMTEHYE